MKIFCISDTHISNGTGKLPKTLYNGLKGADLILHAGDITSMDVIEELSAIAPIEAVAGNMDGWDIAGKLPESRVIEAAGFKIGLAHGGGSVADIEDRVIRRFEQDGVDCIVFGHSHKALVKWVGRVLLVNPGSPTDKRCAPYNSYAVITADTDGISAEIIRL